MASKRGTILAYAFGLLVIALTLAYTLISTRASKEPPVKYGSVPHFELVDVDGQKFESSRLQGKVWLASFIYTRCKGPCPLITAQLTALQADAFKIPGVLFVSFTMDPENDTPSVLKTYAEQHGAQSGRWIFLTGSKQLIRDSLMPHFSLAALDQNSDADPIIHSTKLAVVDKRGAIRGFFNGGDISLNPAILEVLKALERE